MTFKLGATLAALVLSTAAAAQAPVAAERPISFLLFGDSGYIPSYERPEDGETLPATLGDYLAIETKDWLERNANLDNFRPTPWVFETAIGAYMNASGMYPTARGMKQHCARVRCDFAVMLGDNVYPDGATLGADGITDARRFEDMLNRPLGDLGRGVPNFTIYSMMGNHDWHISREATFAQLRYLRQHPNFTMPDLYYRVVPKGFEGEVELFVIDTEMLLAGTKVLKDKLDAEGRVVSDNELEEWPAWARARTAGERDMVGWLERSLRQSTARWKIVLGHHPIWSGGGSKFEKARALRNLYLPILCRYADAYISGDDHMLEAYRDDCRNVPDALPRPLPVLVSGAAAKYRPLHPAFMAQQAATNPQLTNLWSKGATWGFMHATIAGERMTVQALSTSEPDIGPVTEAEFSFARRTGDAGR